MDIPVNYETKTKDSFFDVIKSFFATSIDNEDEVDKSLLRASIEKLSNRERNIMELRFGFISGNEKTQKEVADMLGISQSYISRLEKKIIGKMKKDIMSKTG